MSLIQRLAQLSVNQSGTELQEVDPETGALKPRKIATLGSGRALKEVKTAKNVSMHKEGQPAVSAAGTGR